MKKQSYPPLDLLKQITQEHPKAWEQMAMFHRENGTEGLPRWHDWCYTPMAAAMGVAVMDRDFNYLPSEEKMGVVRVASAIQVLAPWRLSKEVYVLDPDMKNILFDQIDDDLEIPSEILYQLPYPAFYVEVPNLIFDNTEYHGFFVTLEDYVEKNRGELRFLFLKSDGTFFAFPIHIGPNTLSESLKECRRESLNNAESIGMGKDYLSILNATVNEQYRTQKFLGGCLQIVLYILAQNADIVPNSEQTFVTKRGKTIRDKYSEIRKWNVGVRIGSAVRQQKIKEESSEETTQETVLHQSPRPHMRRGHWHHFWTGPKANPEERKLILKWLSPMAIAANPEDTPVVFHKVKQ